MASKNINLDKIVYQAIAARRSLEQLAAAIDSLSPEIKALIEALPDEADDPRQSKPPEREQRPDGRESKPL